MNVVGLNRLDGETDGNCKRELPRISPVPRWGGDMSPSDPKLLPLPRPLYRKGQHQILERQVRRLHASKDEVGIKLRSTDPMVADRKRIANQVWQVSDLLPVDA